MSAPVHTASHGRGAPAVAHRDPGGHGISAAVLDQLGSWDAARLPHF